jgi:hypothetical protein
MQIAKRSILSLGLLIALGATQAQAAPALCINKDGTLTVHSRCANGQKQLNLGSLQGPKGDPGATGVTGDAGTAGASAPILFTATCAALNTSGTEYLSPNGFASATTNMSNAEVIMPVGCVARNIIVHIGTAPGGSGNNAFSRYFGVTHNGSLNGGPGCSITGFNQDCSADLPASLVPGDRIAIYSQTTSNVPTAAEISFECE